MNVATVKDYNVDGDIKAFSIVPYNLSLRKFKFCCQCMRPQQGARVIPTLLTSVPV